MIAAFAMGLFVSLSMQACAEDKDDAPAAKTPAADTHVFDAWKQPGLEYEEIINQSTEKVIERYEYLYNDNGWIIEKIKYGYVDDDLTVGYYLGSKTIWTYTYSDSGEYQYCTRDYINYNHLGTICYINTSKCTAKLYMK